MDHHVRSSDDGEVAVSGGVLQMGDRKCSHQMHNVYVKILLHTVLLGMGGSREIFSSTGCLPCLMASVSVNSGRTAGKGGEGREERKEVKGGKEEGEEREERRKRKRGRKGGKRKGGEEGREGKQMYS